SSTPDRYGRSSMDGERCTETTGRRLGELSLALGGFLSGASGRAARAREPLLGLRGALLLASRRLGVLLGGGGVCARSLATGARLAAQFLRLGGMRLRRLPLPPPPPPRPRGLGGQSPPPPPLLLCAPLCPAPRNERDHRDRHHDNDDEET